jgi:paired amphipathic helix protein Sin3a
VEDALSYLDKVKNQFALQPQVYNQFLDIMKEFKSQSIDTQEVINRVSTLFHGHPDLIVGFNTFLPPGYKIEVSDDHVGYIQVTHPSSRIESIAIGHPSSTYNLSITTPTSTTYHSSGIRQTSNLLNQDNDDNQLTNEISQQSINSTSQAVNALISAATAPQLPLFATTTGGNLTTKMTKQQTNNINSSGQPVEFNHAINYVNKIKNRFHQNPNIYKTFLEILHTYQKQQKDAKESPTTPTTSNTLPTLLSETEVYSKVAHLFTNHEDLLAEFSQFLPDASQQPTERINSITDILLSSSGTSTPPMHPVVSNPPPRLIINNTVSSSMPTSSSFTVLSSNIKDEISHPLSPKRTAAAAATTTTSAINLHKRSMPSSKSPGIAKKKRITMTNNISTVSSNMSDNNIRDSTGQNRKLPSMDEIAFFDKVQKTLRSPLVFDNFLRCILLYTKNIISRIELFELIQSYLGHVPELLKTFQELINLREPGEVIIPRSIYDQNDTDSMITIDYGSCSQYGTSYRTVPRSYIPPACSGRTQLCKEVLNDHCVLFPTFTDESSSVAAKKSVFEEHMYKIEDERFELDIVMEVNLSAIRALESVQLHMNSLTSEQLNNFQLDDQLGGQSVFTQKQAVQRIYGERANEIIDGLKRNPRVAVPIVLKRLKSKDEEWRESKKNFERFWKEQSEKYYLKSLDYMGINCKNSDGRIIRNRHLLNEIENIKEERDQQLTPNNNQPHLIFRYDDLSILDDAASLIVFLVKRQMGFAKEDKQNIKKIMYQFLPDFLFSPRGELSDDEEDDDDDENKREKKTRPTRHTDTNRRRNTESTAAKPRQLAQEYQKPDDMFHLFIVNDNYYYFFRLHQLLCERLLKMFQQSLRLIEQESSSQRNRPTSAASVLRLSNRLNIPVDEYYSVFLDMVRNLLDGNMDSSSYEDSLREMFGIHAYIAFTMDKIIQNCVRQLHAIVTDDSSDAIMRLYSRTNGTAGLVDNLYSISQQNIEAAYQREMESYADGNRLFRICSFKNDRRVTTSLILIDSSDDEDEERITENGTHYTETYLHKNEGDHDETVTARLRARLRKKPRFLHRNLQTSTDQPAPEIVTINNDYCRIDTKTLKRKPFHRAGFFFYRRGSMRSTKQNHKRLALEQYNRFTRFYQDWSSKNISDTDSIDNLCLKTYRLNNNNNNNNEKEHFLIQATLSNNDNDLNQPPYHHYQQYHIVDTEK